jgi:RNA-directed DNA polymerase
MDAWQAIPWRTGERAVFTLQQRIYRASRHGDVTAVHTLQRLFRQSW